MRIDPKSPTPIYRQIVDELQEAIKLGIYKSGECLPSLRAFAVEIGVNPNTVQRAYDTLEREGILESRRGVGVFVVDQRRIASRDAHEQRIEKALREIVLKGLSKDMTVDRLRSLFEHALRATRSMPGGKRK